MSPLDNKLNFAPCGFMTLSDNGTILAANETLSRTLGYENGELLGRRIESILEVPSQVFYRIYFMPLIKLNGNIEEMYLTFLSLHGEPFPMLLNAARREDPKDGMAFNDCVLIPMRRRQEYERRIQRCERKAAQAADKLKRLEAAVAAKQTELDRMTLTTEKAPTTVE